MSKNQSRDPLLYIMQPTLTFPKANMQEKYIVTKTIEKQEEKPLLNEQAKEKFDSQIVEEPLPTSETELIEQEKINNKKKDSPKRKLQTEDVQEIIGQYHQEQSIVEEEKTPSTQKRNKQSYSFKRVKSFKDMNIHEKLNYLVNFPKQLPPVPCIFVSNTSSIKGFLQFVTDDMIEIKQFNNKIVKLNLDELTDIRLIGLK
ncbi:CotO family spore coat protein [Niallia sp. Krafla_26]|uniref:CotO family spore coat protein n=1 Tax=Niallia sp. Krafla_26 TaxID=3064703 RepID=UPI003D1869AD